ncbi:RNB domain-containing ribonuclease [Blastococcus sp. Marseille-P5729]|uniref:RNB domain-containing ribonuclease n=1 Tax=Blastococcus sp. Marseille-P5729 TaxID=2086582 RepID=UPI000D0E7BE9|nr:RNB domain-containing ribonuclease [Blastococcus sp. Marseille-P5729]
MSTRRSVRGADFPRVRADLEVRDQFPPEAIAEAREAAANPRLPDSDDTALPLVTLDPVGAKDLDQAVHIAREDDGYLVSYAIADVAAFVDPGGAIDQEAWRRGQTLYSPDTRVPLHPTELSEDAASLLPGQERPAALWEMRLDADGQVTGATVRRTKVRSIAQLDYEQTQKDFEAGAAHPSLALLAEVGPKRIQLASERHAINLNLPEQVVEHGEHGWQLAYRSQLPCELWNAEISLMTGMAAATMMVNAGTGLLRTLPPAAEETLERVRTTAELLGIHWPDGAYPSDVLDSLDRGVARNVAFIEQAGHLLRGAGYLAFTEGNPHESVHAAIGAVYAHVTAPLRRLVDRYGAEVCLAVSAGEAVPGWVIDALPKLPEVMSQTGNVERRLENAIIDSVEALLLQDSVGERFPAVVVGAGKEDVTVVLENPAVRARARGSAELGETVQVEVLEADPVKPELRLDVVRDADRH